MVSAILIDRVTVSMITEGPITSRVFQRQVECRLVDQLKPGDTVVMDPLSSHKSTAVKQAIESTSARRVDLPPDSPDLNPIEKMASNVNAYLRFAAKRSVKALLRVLGTAFATISESDCRGFFASVGLAATQRMKTL